MAGQMPQRYVEAKAVPISQAQVLPQQQQQTIRAQASAPVVQQQARYAQPQQVRYAQPAQQQNVRYAQPVFQPRYQPQLVTKATAVANGQPFPGSFSGVGNVCQVQSLSDSPT